MANIFFISDTHFGQESIIHFLRPDGTPMRPFANADEMDEALIANWNAVVRPQDHVYHLGDVAMKRKLIPLIGRCNGHKRLLTGNHDIFDTKKDYLPWFEKIYGTRYIGNLLLSHYPIDKGSLKPEWTNVHGHTHANEPMFGIDGRLGPRYLNISCEWTNYAPIAFEEVLGLVELQKRRATILATANK